MKFSQRFWTIVSILWVFTALPVAGQVINDMGLHLEISQLEEPGPPRIIDGQILLTYRSSEFHRYVGASFAHEDYRQIHAYRRIDKEQGPDMFFLLLPVPENADVLEYRLVVDGLWKPDPANPGIRRDAEGRSVSTFSIPPQPEPPITPPLIREDRSVEFVFDRGYVARNALQTIDGRRLEVPNIRSTPVYLAGSFNNFDPFMYRLEPREATGGELGIDLHLPPGTHYYYFVVDGVRVLDPLNETTSVRPGLHRVNRFRVP